MSCKSAGVLHVTPGSNTISALEKFDKLHLKRAERKEQDSSKRRQKRLRAIRKGFEETKRQTEGDTYIPGGFSFFHVYKEYCVCVYSVLCVSVVSLEKKQVCYVFVQHIVLYIKM